MKKVFNKILMIACVATLVSCNKYLDQEPDMRVELDKKEKIASLLVSAYPKKNYLVFAEVASDNVEDKKAANSMHSDPPYPDLYNWSDVLLDEVGTPTDFWNATYEAISASNHALKAIEDGKFGSEIDQYKGEALIARAYNHFMLSVFFAKPYNKDGNNSSPGIPYVKEPNVTVFGNYTRSTVGENYIEIEKDLTEGLKLVNGGKWDVPKYHFTPAAAHAFAARFYLFKKEWDKVIEHVTAIFPNGGIKNSLRPINSTMTNYTFAQYKQEYNMADKAYNLLLTETYSRYQRSSGIGGSRYGMGETKVALHNATTVYGAAFRSNNAVGVWQAPNYILNKFYEYFHYTNVAAGIGLPYMMQALFTVDEALINRAEAYVQKGQYDLAISDLNDFASVRITSYSSANHAFTIEKAKAFTGALDDKTAMLKAILDIKQKAFMQEGIRWMDIIRHDLSIGHNHFDSKGLERVDSLKAGDPRRVFQLPVQAINNGLKPNER
ncbi:RagB/SusD family nutrient uptake outer membrane protein [Sphingobacterium sp.]|uniref:RagB/SusD family nutrient uptake outer membrane protein n=1 Tax=Sphingobacterium sp. TaxID=341027 RepID=UPI00289B32BC|nr:RagB/SusD family nutrient uptake outer membrane protein [Sphingobacterium sp.]